MTKWTEVNVYTGRPVDEDAPANFGGAGSGVDMNPTGMKKKKRLVDARTKSYKTHRARLEAARVKREAKRNGVQEETLDEAKTPSMIDFHFKKGNENDAEKFVDYLKKDKRKLGVKEIILRPFGAKSGGKSTGSSVSIRLGIIGEIETLHKTLDKMKNRFKFNSSVKVDSSGLQTEEVELDEMKKAEIKFHKGSIKTALPKVLKHINLINKKMKVKIKVTQNMSDDSLTLDGGNYDINREVADIINFIGGKNAKVVESVEEKTFSQKVKESISEFGVESLLAEDNVDVLRSIVKRKSAKPIKFKDGTMTIDMQTANMMLTVLDKVKPANQKKLTTMMNGKKSEFMKVHGFVMKALGK